MIDQLPALDSDYRVDPAAVEQFRRDGHVFIRGLAAPEEIQPYRPVIAAAIEEALKTQHFVPSKTTRATNLWLLSEAARRLVCARRFASVAAQLLGLPSVRLYYDQALFKNPGASPSVWHRDRPYFQLTSDRALTCWLPLVDVPKYMGPIYFASGSHVTGETDDRYIPGRWPKTETALRAGDASFHGCWTLHGAGSNRSKKVREAVTIVYCAPDSGVSEGSLESHPILGGADAVP